MMVKVDED